MYIRYFLCYSKHFPSTILIFSCTVIHIFPLHAINNFPAKHFNILMWTWWKNGTVSGKLQAFLFRHVGFVFSVNVAIDVSAAWAGDGNKLINQHPTKSHNVHLERDGEDRSAAARSVYSHHQLFWDVWQSSQRSATCGPFFLSQPAVMKPACSSSLFL